MRVEDCAYYELVEHLRNLLSLALEGYVVCPFCKESLMELELQREELVDGTRRIVYAYRCPLCQHRIYDHVLEIKRYNGRLIVRRIEYKTLRRWKMH